MSEELPGSVGLLVVESEQANVNSTQAEPARVARRAFMVVPSGFVSTAPTYAFFATVLTAREHQDFRTNRCDGGPRSAAIAGGVKRGGLEKGCLQLCTIG